MIDAFHALARHLPTPLLLVTPEGAIVAANEAACHAFGRDPAQVETASLDELLPGCDVRAFLSKCARTTTPVMGAFTLKVDGDVRRFRCEGARVHRDEPFVQLRCWERKATDPFLLLRQKVEELNDEVERRRRAEIERRSLFEELQRALHFREMVLGILGHDLRNPLSAIRMSAEALLRRSHDERDIRSVSRILASAERMARMIDQLLDVSRVRLGSGLPVVPKRVDLQEVCGAAVEELRLAHPERAISVKTSGDTVGWWDLDRLAQVCSNLIGNALQHSSDGHVHVRIDGAGPDGVLLWVRNRGSISAERVSTLFEPFDRMAARDPGSKGLGLGLYITRQIVQSHGGHIDVTSSEEEGTTVRVLLPRTPPLMEAPV